MDGERRTQASDQVEQDGDCRELRQLQEHRCQCAEASSRVRAELALPADMSDQQLAGILYPSITGKPKYKMPDYEYVYREMQRNGVTLNLLWLEYVEKCRLSGDVPYQSTQFNKYYGEYVAKHSATMHLNHKPGEIMQVD